MTEHISLQQLLKHTDRHVGFMLAEIAQSEEIKIVAIVYKDAGWYGVRSIYETAFTGGENLIECIQKWIFSMIPNISDENAYLWIRRIAKPRKG